MISLSELATFWERRRPLLLAFGAGIVASGAAAGVGALAVVQFGLYDTAATAPHNRLVSWALHKTFKQSVRLRAGETPLASQFTADQVVAGFQQYQVECMTCHGGPGVARADWVKGLEPTPPFLLDVGKRYTATQLNYILQKGVKMSAMPAWGATRSPAQIAEVVAFLKALPDISPAQFKALQDRYPATAAPGR
jgi:mono/diheme cytochrome c family protein